MAEKQPEKFTIKAYSKKELALMYNVSAETFRKWLNVAGVMNDEIKNVQILTPKIVELIVARLGEP